MPALIGARRHALLKGVGYNYPAATAAVFGDSISNQNFGSGTFEGHGYLVAANGLMGWPMTSLVNGGVSGNTTTQMLARLGAFLDANPTLGTIFILGGTNDSGAGIAAATTIANLTAMYQACRNRRIRTVALTILPRTDQATGGLAAFIGTVNTAIRASSVPTVVADTHFALADVSNSGLPYANSLYDEVHPAINGAVRMARDAIVPALSGLVSSNAAGVSDNLDFREYASNPMAVGDNADTVNGWRLGTGITGTGPDGWSGQKRATGTGVASKSGSAAQVVGSFAANWDGASYLVGGDDVLALGRYDTAWAATTAQAVGSRRRPTVINGFHYRAVSGGTTGGTQPTWPTTEGATISDGTVTWLCQRSPTAGDKFVATVDLEFSGLVAGKWIVPRLLLSAFNTTSTVFSTAACNAVDLSSTTNFGLDYAPPTMRLVTPEMTLGADTLRYLLARADVFGQAAGGVTMKVSRASIQRTSP